MQGPHQEQLVSTLQNHANLFAWQPSDMSRINLNVVCHYLALCAEAKLVAQRKRKMGGDRRKTIEQETTKLRMYLLDADKTTFMMDGLTYCYQIMLFGLKNTGATYQRLMDKVFANYIGRNLEVYVDDMIVKSTNPKGHTKDL
ncbi:Retrovirus-related Pol polyprotein from transposon gypsy, partial [Mucuna pruriens]